VELSVGEVKIGWGMAYRISN